jgi:hypothetical protein
VLTANPLAIRPIDLPPSVPPKRLGHRARFGVLGTAGWLCLLGMGSSQPVLRAESPAAGTPCRIQQKTPLFVGFAQGMGLEKFEETAIASRDIVRELKHWACDDSVDTSAAVPSLQLAFARSEPIRLDRLQFDEPNLARAHVVLTDSGRTGWRVDFAQSAENEWAVTSTAIATAQDSASP